MRTLALLLLLLAPTVASAQPVAQNLDIAAWLRQVRALGGNASEAAHRRLALRFDPDLPSVCGDEPTGWVDVKPVTSTASLVTLGCMMAARDLDLSLYIIQRVSGRWRARRLQAQWYNQGESGISTTVRGEMEVKGGTLAISARIGSDGFITSTYRLPRLNEPPVLVLLRVEEGSVSGTSRVLYRRRGN